MVALVLVATAFKLNWLCSLEDGKTVSQQYFPVRHSRGWQSPQKVLVTACKMDVLLRHPQFE
jgi:hypothetical protein